MYYWYSLGYYYGCSCCYYYNYKEIKDIYLVWQFRVNKIAIIYQFSHCIVTERARQLNWKLSSCSRISPYDSAAMFITIVRPIYILSVPVVCSYSLYLWLVYVVLFKSKLHFWNAFFHPAAASLSIEYGCMFLYAKWITLNCSINLWGD